MDMQRKMKRTAAKYVAPTKERLRKMLPQSVKDSDVAELAADSGALHDVYFAAPRGRVAKFEEKLKALREHKAWLKATEGQFFLTPSPVARKRHPKRCPCCVER